MPFTILPKSGMFRVILFAAGMLAAGFASGQTPIQPKTDKKLIQLSGVISTGDKIPIPYCTVHIRNTTHGTIAGVDGFYSLVVAEHDTIEYYAGYRFKKGTYIVPAVPGDPKLTHPMQLENDTFTFEPTEIYPWPSKEEFREAFLSLHLEENQAELAKKNLDQEKLAELYETLARDGKENQMYVLQEIASSYYYAGGQKNYLYMGGTPIPTSLLNPFAWAQFIDAIKKGKFKKKEKKSAE